MIATWPSRVARLRARDGGRCVASIADSAPDAPMPACKQQVADYLRTQRKTFDFGLAVAIIAL